MSATAVTLQVFDLYHEGSFLPTHGYLYCTIIVNSSVTLSMYCLVLFYLVTKKELKPHHPIGKFACIKAILFFSFWQSVVIGILTFFNVIPPIGEWAQHEVATALNDFIICIEMFILAVVHPFVFPYQEYMANENGQRVKIKSPHEALKLLKDPVKNFTHVVDQSDLISDIVVSYHPKKVANAKAEQKRLKQLAKADDNEQENVLVEFNVEGEDEDKEIEGFYRL